MPELEEIGRRATAATLAPLSAAEGRALLGLLARIA